MGGADLANFKNLKSLNSYANKLEDLEFLKSLPNKDKLEKLNFYQNQVKEVDLSWLLSEFPNLQSLNLENNPVKAINLEKLTLEQIGKLTERIRDRKWRVNSYRGTILADLLFYIQSLINKGERSESLKRSLEVLTSLTEHKTQAPSQPTNWWVLSGLGVVAVVGVALGIGYWLGKRKYKIVDDED